MTFDPKLALEYKKGFRRCGKAKFPIKALMPHKTSVVDWANRVQVVEQQMENLLGTDYIDIIIEPKPQQDS